MTNNCTSNIVRIIDRGLPRGQRLGLSWRLLFSGYADEFAHDVGRLMGDGPFAELKQRMSRIGVGGGGDDRGRFFDRDTRSKRLRR